MLYSCRVMRMKSHSPILRAVLIAGSQKNLAKMVGVSAQAVFAWIARGAVPAEHCPMIEKATKGQVTCEELRPDLAEQWSYLRGTDKQAA